MHGRGRVIDRSFAVLVFGVAAACGSRSGLLGSSEPGAGLGGAAGSALGGGAGVGGSSGVGGAVYVDAEPDAPPPKPDCTYHLPGDPIVVFSYCEGVHTPMLVVLSGGSSGSPARLAISLIHEHFWHPDIRVAELSISPSWPSGVVVSHAMTGYGVDAHAPGQVTRAAGDDHALALFYFHADEASPNVIPGVKFRRFDASAWAPQPELFVEQLGSYAYSMAPGRAPATNGAWASDGYGVSWRSPVDDSSGESLISPRVALLDAAGSIVRGPVSVGQASAYPGIGATLAWTGQTYLLAHNPRPCSGADPACANQLMLTRLEPGAGQLQLVDTGVVPPLPGLRARTPLARSHAGATWLAWREQPFDAKPGEDVPSTIRLARSTATGELVGTPWQTDAHPDTGAELLASDQGVLLAWGERLDPALEPDTVGHSRLRLRQFSKSGEELQELALGTTRLSYGMAYSVATIDEPRALIVAWTAQDQKPGGQSVAYLMRLDCLAAD
jgi:hypothetical protein